MKRKSTNTVRFRGSQIIATVSVSLVLLMLGIVALTGLAAHHVSNDIRSGIGLVVVIDTDSDSTNTAKMGAMLRSAPYVNEVTMTDADQVLERWQQMMGEDDDKLLDGINPFLPEYDIRVKQEWASADSLEAIAGQLRQMPEVWKVTVHADMATNMNHTINSVIMILLTVAAAMLLVSLVLINNTVRLEIYGSRAIIHTMKYVGATSWFIIRPYVINGLISGVLAGITASALLSALTIYIGSVNPAISGTVTWPEAACVYGGLTVTGAILCAAASLLSTNKYLRKNHDEIFN